MRFDERKCEIIIASQPREREARCAGGVVFGAEHQIQRGSEVKELQHLSPTLPGISSSWLRAALKDVGHPLQQLSKLLQSV